jgi:hypothetical protein
MQTLRRLMIAISLLCVPLLAACQTTSTALGGWTPAQRLYQAHGLYNIALGAATTYAESKFASPGVVQQLTDVNRKAKPAFEYSEAVIACAGPDNSGNLVIKVANARCSVLDLSPTTIDKNAGILQNAKNILLNLLK